MLPRHDGDDDDGSLLEKIKVISGWCIEERRKRAKITQDRLAKDVGVTVRWLREIEAGNPKASIEDHLRCAGALGLAKGYLLILIMFMERKMIFPRELLLDDLAQIEDQCVACIADFSVARLAHRLRPPTRSQANVPG
jgi:transcriptional regulator with XRE-family HTH domain